MKNYLVKSLFRVRDPNWKVVDRSHEQNLFDNYLAMHEISVATFKHFLQGDWELKFITGEVEQINQAFELTFWAIHDLWHSEPCNILYTDPDTMAIQAVEIFGRYQNFLMFNHTDPKEFNRTNPYNRTYPHFFNAGVRYFPATMNESIWQLGRDMAQTWDPSTYDTEQIILNAMLWDQGITFDQAFDPTIAWQLFRSDFNFLQQWNACPIQEARILHLHSSRGAVDRLGFMTNTSQKLGIDIHAK
jgi:hypothetical protein